MTKCYHRGCKNENNNIEVSVPNSAWDGPNTISETHYYSLSKCQLCGNLFCDRHGKRLDLEFYNGTPYGSHLDVCDDCEYKGRRIQEECHEKALVWQREDAERTELERRRRETESALRFKAERIIQEEYEAKRSAYLATHRCSYPGCKSASIRECEDCHQQFCGQHLYGQRWCEECLKRKR